MGRTYSEDLRSRVAAVESGVSCNAAARQFSVSVSCVVKLMQRFRRTGTVTPEPRGKKPYALRGMTPCLANWIAARPKLTLVELHGEPGNCGIRVGGTFQRRPSAHRTCVRFAGPRSRSDTLAVMPGLSAMASVATSGMPLSSSPHGSSWRSPRCDS
jgi:hypothetical protein